MERTPAPVEIHYALWGVLAVPLGFAGTFFVIGLIWGWALGLLATSGLCVVYVSKLSQGSRAAWMLGVLAHSVLLLAGAYYIPRWPSLLAWPLLLLNLYSLGVLIVYRARWSPPVRGTAPGAQPA
jgi:hypothetical protein